VTQKELVQLVDYFVAVLLGDRSETGESLEIVLGNLEERATASDLALVEAQSLHEVHPNRHQRVRSTRQAVDENRVGAKNLRMDEKAGAVARFVRQIAGASSSEQACTALAEIAASQLDVDAAVVVCVHDDRFGVRAVASSPGAQAIDLASLSQWSIEVETFGRELGDAVLAAAGGGLTSAETLPIIADGDLFGVLVLLSRVPIVLDNMSRELAESVVDMTAVMTARLESHAQLARSYAELKASRETLARGEHLRMLGQMAAGVSHDIKNIFNPLGLQLEVLRRRIDRGDQDGIAETLATIRDVVKAGVGLVDRLREFSRQDKEVYSELVDVDAVVATAVDLSRLRAGKSELRVLGKATAPVRARTSELASALVNLILNAIEAGAERVTIETATANGRTSIAVSDDGPGMDADTERRVFEPFFTTKAEGTGLGLAMIFAFVHRHGGDVRLETHEGAGARFTLSFPNATAT
jgi:signal transduction histidine kinase